MWTEVWHPGNAMAEVTGELGSVRQVGDRAAGFGDIGREDQACTRYHGRDSHVCPAREGAQEERWVLQIEEGPLETDRQLGGGRGNSASSVDLGAEPECCVAYELERVFAGKAKQQEALQTAKNVTSLWWVKLCRGTSLERGKTESSLPN